MPPRPSPTHEDSRAARQHRRRRSRGKGPSIIALRIAHLTAWFEHVYGDTLPDDDAGREDVMLLLHHLASADDARERMRRHAATWAPWMPEDELDRLIDAVIARPRRFKADTLAQKLGVTMAHRERLQIWSIGATDKTAEQRRQDRRERARKRKQALRRAAGAKPRLAYLAEIAARAAKPKPWEAAGMSRSAWYRARQPDTHAA